MNHHPEWASPRIILASSSPRRRLLIERLGIQFEVAPSSSPEETRGTSPSETACLLAMEKAGEIASRFPDALVVGVDTVIDLDGELIGKPEDDEDAVRILEQLRARVHHVISGIAIGGDSYPWQVHQVRTDVLMRAYDTVEVSEYVRSGEPRDKAGAYAIQGLGGSLVESYEGCFFNIVGLPVCELARLLPVFGVTLQPVEPACARPDGTACPDYRPRKVS